MIQANFQAMEPTLLEHGYAASDIAALNRDCLTEVSHQANNTLLKINETS
jgi:hypothetical protein